jgi:hypothetical protein
MLEEKLLSGKPEKRLSIPSHVREALKESGENPKSFTLISHEKVLDKLR